MLRYTGHPLVDVGLATITAFANKREPSTLALDDLEEVADFIARNYVADPLKSFLNVAFPNSGFTNPAFRDVADRRKKVQPVLTAYKSTSPRSSETCIFTGLPATALAFSDSLPAGRAFRQHVPMTTGEGVINFHPGGDAGLPVSGEALLCIQAFPMGCAKCGGKLLAVHSDNPDLTYEFAARFLADNRQALTLAQQSGAKKMPEAPMSAKTLVIKTLLEVEIQRRAELEQERPASVTAYHLTNSGQSNPLDARNPPLEIYHLPLQLTMFLSLIRSPDYKDAWQAIANRAWQLDPPKKEKKSEEKAETKERPKRNYLYEDLFQLPGEAAAFVRLYFLRMPIRSSFAEDPRRAYRLRDEASLVSWKLTDLLLKEVMNMDQNRIKEIRDLADRLAAYISRENDRRFFDDFFGENRSYDSLRNALIKANWAHVKKGHAPLIMLDPYITVFEDGVETTRSDWRFARDLVLIRMIEQLYHQGWLGKNLDAVHEKTADTTELETKGE